MKHCCGGSDVKLKCVVVLRGKSCGQCQGHSLDVEGQCEVIEERG